VNFISPSVCLSVSLWTCCLSARDTNATCCVYKQKKTTPPPLPQLLHWPSVCLHESRHVSSGRTFPVDQKELKSWVGKPRNFNFSRKRNKNVIWRKKNLANRWWKSHLSLTIFFFIELYRNSSYLIHAFLWTSRSFFLLFPKIKQKLVLRSFLMQPFNCLTKQCN
jgi:hypothetical protein